MLSFYQFIGCILLATVSGQYHNGYEYRHSGGYMSFKPYHDGDMAKPLKDMMKHKMEPSYKQPEPYKHPEPAYKQPEPYKHPEPAYKPEPTYKHPEPAYKHPEPAYKHPEPAYKHPEPAYKHPEPMYKHPEPAYKHPEPMYKHPEPAYHHPEPMYHKPEPAYHHPDPMYHHPEPAYKNPEPAYPHHEPMYGHPEPQYNHYMPYQYNAYHGYQHQPSHPMTYKDMMMDNYHQPAYQPYQPHKPVYTAFSHPNQPYKHPEPAYKHPEPAYKHPEPAYKHPEPAYKHPEPAYKHPEPMYGHHGQKDMMMKEEEKAVAVHKPAAKHEPKYLGQFKNAKNRVEGDIFQLDDSTLYIQGFSFDGQAPEVYFWSDGVAIPYYTRSNPNMQMIVGEYNKEDVVLMLPPEKPTVKDLGHFQVWCNKFKVVFGEFDMV